MDKVKEWLKDYRIQIALVLILAIIVLYFGYFRRKKTTSKKSSKKPTKKTANVIELKSILFYAIFLKYIIVNKLQLAYNRVNHFAYIIPALDFF